MHQPQATDLIFQQCKQRGQCKQSEVLILRQNDILVGKGNIGLQEMAE